MNKVIIVAASMSDQRMMVSILTRAGYMPILAENIDAAKDEVAKLPPGAVIVAAMKFRDGTAQELINWQKSEGYKFPLIAIVDNLSGIDIADVMKDGGAVNIIQRQAIDKQLLDMLGNYIRPEGDLYKFPNVLIPRQSESFRKIEKSLPTIAATNANVVIFGESGTGKSQIANEIYRLSARSQKPFTVIEAGGAALIGTHDPTTFRSETYNRIAGYFKDADGGTIIIKNIQLLTFDKQSVLLHILETVHPNVRVICTADQDLAEMVAAKEFRPNLFYVLRQIDITVPALREAPEDIVPLARVFLSRFSDKVGGKQKHFDAAAEKALRSYPFPGNVRELKDLITFAAFHSAGEVITISDLNFSQTEPPAETSLRLQDEALEKAKIVAALRQAEGNKSLAAKLLGIGRTTLAYKLKQYGVK